MQYGFPGNVRELRNIVIRLTTKYAGQSVNGEQLLAELDWEEPVTAQPGVAQTQDFKSTVEAARKHLQGHKNFNLDDALRELEKSYVEAALDITRGNLSQAAKLLGIHRTTLYSRMQSNAAAGEEEQ
jgi:DNA-binding NtrC family response regulator